MATKQFHHVCLMKKDSNPWRGEVRVQGRVLTTNTVASAEEAAKAVDRYLYKLNRPLNFPATPEFAAELDALTLEQVEAQFRQIGGKRTSQYRAVQLHKPSGQWQTYLTVPGCKSVFLGRYPTQEDAASAYDLAAYVALGRTAKLNLPDRLLSLKPEEIEAQALNTLGAQKLDKVKGLRNTIETCRKVAVTKARVERGSGTTITVKGITHDQETGADAGVTSSPDNLTADHDPSPDVMAPQDCTATDADPLNADDSTEPCAGDGQAQQGGDATDMDGADNVPCSEAGPASKQHHMAPSPYVPISTDALHTSTGATDDLPPPTTDDPHTNTDQRPIATHSDHPSDLPSSTDTPHTNTHARPSGLASSTAQATEACEHSARPRKHARVSSSRARSEGGCGEGVGAALGDIPERRPRPRKQARVSSSGARSAGMGTAQGVSAAVTEPVVPVGASGEVSAAEPVGVAQGVGAGVTEPVGACGDMPAAELLAAIDRLADVSADAEPVAGISGAGAAATLPSADAEPVADVPGDAALPSAADTVVAGEGVTQAQAQPELVCPAPVFPARAKPARVTSKRRRDASEA